MPPRTARTTVRRKCVCVAMSNFRASGLFFMPKILAQYALFNALISNCPRHKRIEQAFHCLTTALSGAVSSIRRSFGINWSGYPGALQQLPDARTPVTITMVRPS